MSDFATSKISIKWKTIAVVVVAFAGFLFGTGVAFTTFRMNVAANSENIDNMMPLVNQIPLVEYKIDVLTKGQEEIKLLIKKQ